MCSFKLMRPCNVGAVPCEFVEVTAADRAAATVRAEGGRICGRGRLSPLRRRDGGRSPSGSFPITHATPSAPTYRLVSNIKYQMKRWQVAAALSAAVTATKPIGDRPHSQAEPTKKKSRTPNASRSSGEGVWGGGASLREAASSPESPSKNKNPLPSMQNGSGTMAAYRRDGDYFRDAPSASQAASASASGSSWQVTLSQANTMPAARQLSSQVRIHSPSPQP